MVKTENAIRLKPKFFPVTSVSEAGVRTYSNTSIIPDGICITGFQCASPTIEQREIEDIAADTLVTEFDTGKITPPQITLNINPKTSMNSLLSSFDLTDPDETFAGQLAILKKNSSNVDVRVFVCDANLMEDASMDGTARQKLTGSIKFQATSIPIRGAAAAVSGG